jgi:hypothetical protein
MGPETLFKLTCNLIGNVSVLASYCVLAPAVVDKTDNRISNHRSQFANRLTIFYTIANGLQLAIKLLLYICYYLDY